MKRGWLPGRGPVCQVSPRQSFMAKYAIKPFERGAYSRSPRRPSPLRGSTWCCCAQGACRASISCSVLSRRHLPVAGAGSPLPTRAAPHGTQPCPDPNGVLCIWDALLPPLGPCRRGREHGWREAGDGGRGLGTPRCVGRAQCHVDGTRVPMGLPHSSLSLGTGHPRMSPCPPAPRRGGRR